MEYLAQHPWAFVITIPCCMLCATLIVIALLINLGRFGFWLAGFRKGVNFDDPAPAEFRMGIKRALKETALESF
jgi:formate hydrogenlyase subunit 4